MEARPILGATDKLLQLQTGTKEQELRNGQVWELDQQLATPKVKDRRGALAMYTHARVRT